MEEKKLRVYRDHDTRVHRTFSKKVLVPTS